MIVAFIANSKYYCDEVLTTETDDPIYNKEDLQEAITNWYDSYVSHKDFVDGEKITDLYMIDTDISPTKVFKKEIIAVRRPDFKII